MRVSEDTINRKHQMSIVQHKAVGAAKRGFVRDTRVAFAITAQKKPLLQYYHLRPKVQSYILKPLNLSVLIRHSKPMYFVLPQGG